MDHGNPFVTWCTLASVTPLRISLEAAEKVIHHSPTGANTLGCDLAHICWITGDKELTWVTVEL